MNNERRKLVMIALILVLLWIVGNGLYTAGYLAGMEKAVQITKGDQQ